jgi:hypothetical protein
MSVKNMLVIFPLVAFSKTLWITYGGLWKNNKFSIRVSDLFALRISQVNIMIKKILLSLDVEEFDIPEEYGQKVDDLTKIRVSAEGLTLLLDLLEELNLTITCFTTVYFAQRQPALMERIIRRHELASHGVKHATFNTGDLLASRLELEKLSGSHVHGFRRPRLKIVDSSEVLAAGYSYNSSENPIWLPGRYMHFFRPRLPYLSGDLVNLPVSTSPIIRYPLFWLSFKNSPLGMFKKMSAWALESGGYLNIFFHPWEFVDLSAWRLPASVKRLSGMKMLSKLSAYLLWLKDRAEFTTCAAFAESFRKAKRGE